MFYHNVWFEILIYYHDLRELEDHDNISKLYSLLTKAKQTLNIEYKNDFAKIIKPIYEFKSLILYLCLDHLLNII